jgi:hypothetical protein
MSEPATEVQADPRIVRTGEDRYGLGRWSG